MNYNQQKKILVTGGCGFVGSHLVESLIRDAHKVFVYDDLSTGNKSNLQEWFNNPNLKLITSDIINDLVDIDTDIDEIYHLASAASPKHYMKDSIKTLKTNFLGTLNVLEFAKKCGAKVLIASTSEVYGDPSVHPQDESYWGNVNPIGPRSCYDEGKRVSESLAYSFKHQANVDIRIARIFNTYGPRMQIDDGRVVSNFVIQSLNNEPITIYGDGSQTRSFQYIDDLIRGLKNLMLHDFVGPINLGNPNEMTVLEFAMQIKKLIPESTSSIIHEDLPIDDPLRRKPDISKAFKHIDWYPQVCLADGLKLTIEYFRSKLDATKALSVQ